MSTNRRRWSWRSCFTLVKHNQKSKKQDGVYSNRPKIIVDNSSQSSYLAKLDENSNLLSHYDESSHVPIDNDYKTKIASVTSINEFSLTKISEETVSITKDYFQSSSNHSQSLIINQKSQPSARSTPLDAIVEESNEDNADESNEPPSSIKFRSDREIIQDCLDLTSRLNDLSKMNHIIIQFNDNIYLHGEFTRQINKLKSKTDDVERASTESPRDAELLEARYSTLLATIETLSLLLKIAQICSSRLLISRLSASIEQRMEQLNKLIQLRSTSSVSFRQSRQDTNDDDFLSVRSVFSSYEHLLNT